VAQPVALPGFPVQARGATFDVEMSAQPNLQRGTAPADAPYSFSRERKP
jgi:putative alpha-1,2-mannosidase